MSRGSHQIRLTFSIFSSFPPSFPISTPVQFPRHECVEARATCQMSSCIIHYAPYCLKSLLLNRSLIACAVSAPACLHPLMSRKGREQSYGSGTDEWFPDSFVTKEECMSSLLLVTLPSSRCHPWVDFHVSRPQLPCKRVSKVTTLSR